ncbi:MAG: alpha/beta hydrolase [Candidatus Parvarchaeota archaeon]
MVDNLKSDYMTIIPDLPGHGKSWPWINWRKRKVDVEFYAETISKLLEELGIERIMVLGCSIGADIALMLTTMIGDKIRLVICAEGAGKTNTFVEQEILKTEPGNVERAFDFCGRRATKGSIEDLIWIRSSNNRDIYIGDLLAWNNFDIMKKLPSINTKIILMRGEDDPVVTDEMLKDTSRELRNSEQITLPGFGHYPMIEDPVEFARIINSILEKYE